MQIAVSVHDLDRTDEPKKREVERSFADALLALFPSVEAAAEAQRAFESVMPIACTYPADDAAQQAQMRPWFEAVDVAWAAAFSAWGIPPRRDEPYFEVTFA